MKDKRIFTCIVCPNGCTINTLFDGDTIFEINGQQCKRGEEYVRQELTDPRRTIASSVPISGAALPLCSVRLTKAIPKREIPNVMREINKANLAAPVLIGHVVIKNVCGLGSDVIVTKNISSATEV